MNYILELNGITKTFGCLIANDHVDIKVTQGSVHAIVGENGAGKSTLMNIVYGLLHPDSGKMLFEGKQVSFASPMESIAAGLGMIHQHFMLIPTMTVLDNIILGYEIGSVKLNRRQSQKELQPLFDSFGLSADLFQTKLGKLPVGVQQKVEIIKALYRKAKLIVFDEPTAVLTPQEIAEFFVLVGKLKQEGKTIIFISHKLSEIMELSDEITIMRAGKVVSCVGKQNITEGELAKLMIGRDLAEQRVTPKPNSNPPAVEVRNLETQVRLGSVPLKELSFTVKKGEVFGIAGVAGNGQTELVNILVGTQFPAMGQVFINGTEVTRVPSHKRAGGMGYIPEDRQTEGLIMPFTVAQNLILGKTELPQFLKHHIFLNFKQVKENADKAVRDYSIKVSSGIQDPVKSLSGGNQQKVIVARELNDNPQIILAVNPTRGIDIGSIEYIHSCIIAQREQGKTIVLVSNELSEIMALSDRIGVIHDGKIVKTLNNTNVTKEQIGFYMLGGRDEDPAGEGAAT